MVNGVVAPKSRLDRDVVEQARRADRSGRDQAHRSADFVERLEGQRIDQREIVDLRETCGR